MLLIGRFGWKKAIQIQVYTEGFGQWFKVMEPTIREVKDLKLFFKLCNFIQSMKNQSSSEVVS